MLSPGLHDAQTPSPPHALLQNGVRQFCKASRALPVLIANDANPRGLGAFLENLRKLTYSYPTGYVRKPVTTQAIGSIEGS
jgi:hypothetical protein